MKATESAFLGHLAWVIPALRPLLDEHLDDHHGVMLPHLLISDFERWAEQAFENGDPALRKLLDELESAYATGDEAIQELVSVSFLELVPQAHEEGANLRSLLGPALSAQIAEIDRSLAQASGAS